MFSEKWKHEIFTIPNLLSLFRIALIPVYISIYRNAEHSYQYHFAGIVLAISCITDLADGIIARKFDMITDTGKLLDPLADKLTQLALMLSLSARHVMLYPVLILFIIKELFQSGACLFFARRGKCMNGALWAGKICTTFLFFSLFLMFIFPGIPEIAVTFLAVMDICVLLYAFCSYMIFYVTKQSNLTDLKPKI